MSKPFPGYPKGYEFDEPALDRDDNPMDFEDKYPKEIIEEAGRILKHNNHRECVTVITTRS